LSSLQTTKTHVDRDGKMLLPSEGSGELIDSHNLGCDPDHLIESEEQYLGNFLQSIDCPSDININYSDSGSRFLLSIFEDSYDHIPGAPSSFTCSPI
jgi:hypothetical protein